MTAVWLVTPPRDPCSMAWNPWATLKTKGHIRLERRPLTDEMGFIEDPGDGTLAIVLADDLNEAERNATLGHELSHAHLDMLYDDETPPWLVEKYELWTDKHCVREMIPQDELIAFVEANQEFMHITVAVVAEYFRVTEEMALAAIERMPAF